jgi:hypothetical protein
MEYSGYHIRAIGEHIEFVVLGQQFDRDARPGFLGRM